MKAVVAAFNQEKVLVGAFSVITNSDATFWSTYHYTHPQVPLHLALAPDLGVEQPAAVLPRGLGQVPPLVNTDTDSEQ